MNAAGTRSAMCAKSSPTGRMPGSDYEEPLLARFRLTLVDALGESDRPLTRTRDDRFATVPIVAPTAWPWPPAIPELWVPYNRRLCPTPRWSRELCGSDGREDVV